MLTLPQFGEVLKKLHQKEADAKLTKAALETLAIVAYKQPILRADVEAIRGCACGETIRSLMEKHLVKIAGRAEEPGRPILYGTTNYGGGKISCNGGYGCGTVFEIAPDGTFTLLHKFKGPTDGANPTANLIADAAGNLYSTAEFSRAVA